MYIWKEKRGVFVESFFWLFSLEKFLCRPKLMHSDLTYKETHCWTITDDMFLYINKTFTFNGISIIWILFWYHRYNQHSVHLNFWVCSEFKSLYIQFHIVQSVMRIFTLCKHHFLKPAFFQVVEIVNKNTYKVEREDWQMQIPFKYLGFAWKIFSTPLPFSVHIHTMKKTDHHITLRSQHFRF